MATVLGAVSSSVQASLTSSQALSTTFSGNPSVNYSPQFTPSEITKAYFQSYTVTTSGTSIDLTSLTDVWGSPLSFATLKHLTIWNTDTINGLSVGGATSGVVSALPTLWGRAPSVGSPGSCHSITTPITVNSTHKILNLSSTAGTVTAELFLLGI